MWLLSGVQKQWEEQDEQAGTQVGPKNMEEQNQYINVVFLI